MPEKKPSRKNRTRGRRDDWPAADNLSYQINLVHRMLDRQTKKFLAENVDLTSAERSVLGYITWHSPNRIVDIAEETAIYKSQVSQAMRVLERKGLVDRTDDPEDERGFLFEVTAKGRQLQKRIVQWTRKRQKTLASRLTEQQRRLTMESLRILGKYLRSAT